VKIQDLLREERAAVETSLDRLLPDESAWPSRLHAAMRYAVFGGGKRIRPILARLAHRAAGGDADDITAAACGIELIHTYSLIHDDLPALDDDVLRRGRSTVHVAFDEATAILTGDALLTLGLEVLATCPEPEAWAARRARAVALVAAAAGSRGMVGGQVEDLAATGHLDEDGGAAASRLELIHRHKTGDLLRASVQLGAVLAGAAPETEALFAEFGARLGMAFQVADDILDATATAEELGKSPGKDEAAGKLTFVTLYGLDRARAILHDLESRLESLASQLEAPGGPLGALAHFICQRRS